MAQPDRIHRKELRPMTTSKWTKYYGLFAGSLGAYTTPVNFSIFFQPIYVTRTNACRILDLKNIRVIKKNNLKTAYAKPRHKVESSTNPWQHSSLIRCALLNISPLVLLFLLFCGNLIPTIPLHKIPKI